MSIVIANRVLETSTTTGSGAYTLAGAVTGYQAFSAAPAANGDTLDYFAEDINPSTGALVGGWEVGTGTWGTGGTLTRTTVIASSNAGAAVVWAAGTRRIGLSLSAQSATRARNASPPLLALGNVSGAVTLDLNAARAFSMNLTGNVTLSLSGTLSAVVLESLQIAVAANGFAITWPASFKWLNNSAPTIYTSGKSLFVADSYNAGAAFAASVKLSLYDVAYPTSLHWQILVNATNGDSYVEIAELFLMYGGAIVSIPANIITTSDSGHYLARTASWAFDGIIGTSEDNTWCSSGAAMPQSMRVQYSAVVTADAIKIYPTLLNPGSRSTRDFSLQISSDAVSWTTVKSWTGMNSWVSGTGVVLSLL